MSTYTPCVSGVRVDRGFATVMAPAGVSTKLFSVQPVEDAPTEDAILENAMKVGGDTTWERPAKA